MGDHSLSIAPTTFTEPEQVREVLCHEPCTATVHGRPTHLRTDLFETVIECTATDQVIFS